MTLKIEIEVPADVIGGDNGLSYLRRAMGVLGFERAAQAALSDAVATGTGVMQTTLAPSGSATVEHVPTEDLVAKTETAAPTRERGKPSPGRARRTKEEIAEDEAADKADAARNEAATDAAIQADNADDVRAAISTGEERIAPDDPRDAEDEAAETEAARKDGAVTLDDLRNAVGAYSKKFGVAAAAALFAEGGKIGKPMADITDDEMADAVASVLSMIGNDAPEKPAPTEAPKELSRDDVLAVMTRYLETFGKDAALADGPKIFERALGPVPPGTKKADGKVTDVWALSAIPTDQDSLRKSVEFWTAALTERPQPFGRVASNG